jgi:tyrosine-protein phosphatase SIW14
MDSRSNSTAPLSTTPLSSAFSTITPATTPPSLLSLLTAAPALGADLPPDSQPQKHERGASHLPPGLSHPAQPVQLQPPVNLAQVFAGVYRSSFPKRRNLEFLRDIGVKTILTLMLEEYPEANMRFYKENGMRFVQFGAPLSLPLARAAVRLTRRGLQACPGTR